MTLYQIFLKNVKIKIVLFAILFIAINISATAQKGKVLKATTAAPAKPTPITMAPKTEQAQVDQAIVEKVKAVDLSQFQVIPKQDPQLAKFTGTIKIESDSLFEFTDIKKFGTYIIYLNSVQYNWSTPTPAGGLLPVEYSFKNMLVDSWYKNVIVTKVNDRLYNYTIFNVPINVGVVVSFYYTDNASGDAFGGTICSMKVTGAFTEKEIRRGNGIINASPNYQATIAGQVLALPIITISNPPPAPILN
jgi:hypothetical protein